MKRPVRPSTERALFAAMDRLLTGRATASDGRLTVVNLAKEAGVSRATANRADLVLMKFRRAITELCDQPAARDQVDQTAGEERKRREIENLLAQHVQVRALQQRREEPRAAGPVAAIKRQRRL